MVLVAEILEWEAQTIVQVGIGHYHKEIEVFKEAWPTCDVIGFEPQPHTYDKLEDYQGEIRKVGLADKPGKATMWYRPRHKDGGTMCNRTDDDKTDTVEVPISTLDLEFPRGSINTQHNMLWLDCEGYEEKVIRGAARTLKQFEVINVELTTAPISAEWCKPQAVHQLLEAQGYKRQWIHTQRISHGQCDVIYVQPHLFRPEYCCCPCQTQ